jgi:hypothetical protein
MGRRKLAVHEEVGASMAKPTEIHYRKAEVGDKVAIHRDGSGFAWQLHDVVQHPERYEWRTVTGRDTAPPYGDGLRLDKGGPGLNGNNVIVLR